LTTENVFDPNTLTPEVVTESPPPVPDKPPVDEKSLLLKRIEDKDAFIEQLKTENAEMRRVTQEVEQLKARLKETPAKPEPEGNTGPALTKEAIENLVANTITARERMQTADQNVREANATMVQSHGSLAKAAEFLKQKAADLGLSLDDLKATAAKSPKAFFQLVGNTAPVSNKSIDKKSSVIPEAFSGSGPKPGTKAYFDTLKKEKGSTHYFSVGVQQQILAAKRSGTYDA
jgi:type II secretory pathway component PulM